MMRVAACVLLVMVAGCDDMTHQPKRDAYSDSRVGPGQTPSRTVVEYQSQPATAPPLTLALIERGQQRFRIYCTPCHSELGDGNGMIVQRGFPAPPSYHIQRLSRRARAALLRRHHQWLWRDVLVRLPRPAARPLGDRCVYPRPAAQPERNGRGPDARPAGGTAMKADRYALPVGVLGLAIATYGWRLQSGAASSAGWLAALTLFSAWPLGSIALLLIHSLTGGRWGEVLRPALRVGVCRCLCCCRRCCRWRPACLRSTRGRGRPGTRILRTRST